MQETEEWKGLPNADVALTDSEVPIVKKGVRAQDMSEKWNIAYCDDILTFSRSWTGLPVFRTKILDFPPKIFDVHVNIRAFKTPPDLKLSVQRGAFEEVVGFVLLPGRIPKLETSPLTDEDAAALWTSVGRRAFSNEVL